MTEYILLYLTTDYEVCFTTTSLVVDVEVSTVGYYEICKVTEGCRKFYIMVEERIG